jgi:hypothetical protein
MSIWEPEVVGMLPFTEEGETIPASPRVHQGFTQKADSPRIDSKKEEKGQESHGCVQPRIPVFSPYGTETLQNQARYSIDQP